MTRPRIEGMDEKIISSFVDRKIFSSQREVITAALRALVREQKTKEASEREAQAFSDETYKTQLSTELENENASVGNTRRSAALR
jgi:Arc/MetJ-type ribon-helix-helix transcriptional regulator